MQLAAYLAKGTPKYRLTKGFSGAKSLANAGNCAKKNLPAQLQPCMDSPDENVPL